MASEVDVANRALTKLGAARITALSDANKQARAVDSMFDIVRDALLRSHVWSFAVKRATLDVSETTPDWGYAYQYDLPADYLRLVQVNDTYLGPSLADFRNESTSDYMLEGNVIMTDIADTLKIRYIFQETDTTAWDSTFVEAMACRLAAELAEDLTQSNTKRDAAWKEYDMAIRTAIRSGAVEQQAQEMPDDAWMLSRI